MILQEGVTQLLIDWSAGDESALEKLTPLVYDELRRRASLVATRAERIDFVASAAEIVGRPPAVPKLATRGS